MSSWPEINEELHKKLHFKPKTPKYEPVTVSEALAEMNAYVNAVVDLGTYAFLSGENSISKHMIELEHMLDNIAYQILAHVSLTVGHDVDKAMGAIPLYIYVSGIDKITDSFKDLAYLSLMGYSPSKQLYSYYVCLSDVITSTLNGDLFNGKTIGWIKEEFAVEPIALLRRNEWILIPEDETVLHQKDRVYVTGVKENINDLLKEVGLPQIEGVMPPKDVKEIVSSIDSMIDIVKLLNDLAHYQLKAQDPSMIEEVMEIEMFVDTLRLKVSEKIMRTNVLDARNKFSLISLVTRLEDVTDAVTYTLTLPAKDVYRDVLSQIVESTGERVRSFMINKGLNIKDFQDRLEDLDASILAVKKKGEWIAITPYNMGKLSANPGDSLLIMYPQVLEEDVMNLMKDYSKIPAEEGKE